MRVTFEFVGGPYDGKTVCGFLGDAGDAERHYLFTNHGTVGYLFKVASEYAIETLARGGLKSGRRHNFQKHFYVVAERLEDEDEVCVRAEYAPNPAEARPGRRG